MKTLFFLITTILSTSLLMGCASKSKTPSPPPPSALDTQLKVTSGSGRLKAKLALTNLTKKEMIIKDLDPQFFKVETTDNKPMPFKGPASRSENSEPIRLKPGQTLETAFLLQHNYPFWDRRTKYKIRYDGPTVKSNEVSVWY